MDDGGGGDYWTTGAITRAKLQSNHHHQHPVFLQFECPSCRATNSVKALKGKISHSMDLLTPSSPGVFQLCLWPLIAPGHLGEGCHASHQPSDASTPVPWLSKISKSHNCRCRNTEKATQNRLLIHLSTDVQILYHESTSLDNSNFLTALCHNMQDT